MRLQTAMFFTLAVSCCCFGCTDGKSTKKSELRTAVELARPEAEPDRENPDARFDALLSQFNERLSAGGDFDLRGHIDLRLLNCGLGCLDR